MKGTIQGTTKAGDIQLFATSIVESDYQEIRGFYTFENKYTNSIVNHEAVIDLKSDTRVAKLDSLTPLVPNYYFNFTNFAQVLARGKGYSLIQKLPASSNIVRSLEEQINENRMTIKEELCMDPYYHKNERFTYRPSISDFDLFRGWWYQSCLECIKALSGKGKDLRFTQHDVMTPTPWFRLDYVIIDGNGVATFVMVSKTVEHFFRSFAHQYECNKEFADPFTITPPMVKNLNKIKIFHL